MKTNIRTQALFDGVGGIEDTYIEEAQNFTAVRRTHGRLFRFAAVAASIALLIGCICFRDTANPDAEPNPYFVLTAYADNGVDTSISNVGDVMNVSCTSGVTNGMPFGPFGNHQTFYLKITLGNLVASYSEFTALDFTISYNGIAVKMGDEHLAYTAILQKEDSAPQFGYHVWGWFDERTQIEISFTDVTGTVIMRQTIVVTPYSDSYDISIAEQDVHEKS